MFEISVKSHFSAAHHLREYPGKCAAVHGHNWDVQVFVRSERVNSHGMVEDFGRIKEVVRQCLSAIDHGDLNAHPDFARQNPTSENMAAWLHGELSRKLNSGDLRVHRVCVAETPETMAAYWE